MFHDRSDPLKVRAEAIGGDPVPWAGLSIVAWIPCSSFARVRNTGKARTHYGRACGQPPRLAEGSAPGSSSRKPRGTAMPHEAEGHPGESLNMFLSKQAHVSGPSSCGNSLQKVAKSPAYSSCLAALSSRATGAAMAVLATNAASI